MEFTFSEDQRELRRSARRFLEVESSEERVRAAMGSERGYDPAVWKQLSEELAWTALTIPEAYGGLGAQAGTSMETKSAGTRFGFLNCAGFFLLY